MASKIAILGDVNGNFAVFDKLAKIQAKQAFSFAAISGDLFADPANDASSENIQKLISGQITIPLPTYFTIGRHALPTAIVQRLSENSDEVCENLYYLGKRSTFKTSEGVRIVALGGLLNTEIIANSGDDKYLPFHTEQDAKVLYGAHNADILITSSWPNGVRKGSNVALPEGTAEPPSEQCVAELVKILKPRYHFCASSDLFYEREPFYFTPPENAPDITPVTRFLSVASFGSSTKAKWLYAFNLDPTRPAPTAIPAGAKPSPFQSPNLKKRSLPESYHYSHSGHEGRTSGKRRHGGQQGRARPPRQDECFFCLSNANTSTHLITAIGDDAYLTTSRGPVPTSSTFSPVLDFPAHILIIPLAHSPTIASIPSSAGDTEERDRTYAEMLKFRMALNEMVKAKGQGKLGSVCWEINKQAGVHVHWQWMPIDLQTIERNLVEAGLKVQAEGDGYGTFEQREVGDGSEAGGDWFRIWVWQPSKTNEESEKEVCWFLPLDPTQKFDLQFGRRVMAKLLNIPQRAHWKDVVQLQEEEEKDVSAFKEAFKPWDFSES